MDTCSCGRKKLIVAYIIRHDQSAKLKKNKLFVEPYPDGARASLLVCGECDYATQWPAKTKPRKNRLR